MGPIHLCLYRAYKAYKAYKAYTCGPAYTRGFYKAYKPYKPYPITISFSNNFKNKFMDPSHFLPLKGNYRQLTAFQKAECIYDITFYFAHKYIENGDRTRDQMVQAARSGKQNIAEGCADGTTSTEMEMKLINVAKSSLHELLLDYEDYLRVRNLELWDFQSEKGRITRGICARHNESAFYREAITLRNDTAIANIAITLIHQTDYLLRCYLEALKKRFLEEGGLKEQMYRARIQSRNYQKK